MHQPRLNQILEVLPLEQVLEGQAEALQGANLGGPGVREEEPALPHREPGEGANLGGVVQREPRLLRPCVVDDPW